MIAQIKEFKTKLFFGPKTVIFCWTHSLPVRDVVCTFFNHFKVYFSWFVCVSFFLLLMMNAAFPC